MTRIWINPCVKTKVTVTLLENGIERSPNVFVSCLNLCFKFLKKAVCVAVLNILKSSTSGCLRQVNAVKDEFTDVFDTSLPM